MIEREELRQLFDIATHSLDFGSGFLDDEEVELLRKVAVTIGVDPMLGTPDNFAAKYPHAFKPKDYDGTRCDWDCNRPVDSEIHAPEAA